jgi:hypothetical protein
VSSKLFASGIQSEVGVPQIASSHRQSANLRTNNRLWASGDSLRFSNLPDSAILQHSSLCGPPTFFSLCDPLTFHPLQFSISPASGILQNHRTTVLCYPWAFRPIGLASANPIGEIGSGYPTNVYDGNRLSLPILRQKMCYLLYDLYWLARWLLLWGSKYLEYNSSIRTEKCTV